MKISLIVAAADNGVIGRAGQIPWSIKGEQAIFKRITIGHPIIMGRKTHESLPKTLPGRLNVVISRNPDYQVREGSVLAGSLEEAWVLPAVKAASEVFIIGGEDLYKQALPLASQLYLTRVHTTIEDGDKFFHFDPASWRLISSEKHDKDEANQRPYDFDFQIWRRI
jgi:dihydrofolate reductase